MLWEVAGLETPVNELVVMVIFQCCTANRTCQKFPVINLLVPAINMQQTEGQSVLQFGSWRDQGQTDSFSAQLYIVKGTP